MQRPYAGRERSQKYHRERRGRERPQDGGEQAGEREPERNARDGLVDDDPGGFFYRSVREVALSDYTAEPVTACAPEAAGRSIASQLAGRVPVAGHGQAVGPLPSQPRRLNIITSTVIAISSEPMPRNRK